MVDALISTTPPALSGTRTHVPPRIIPASTGDMRWCIEVDGHTIGVVTLDDEAPDVDASLRRYGPAMRLHIDFGDSHLAILALHAFLAFARTDMPHRLMTASCPLDDLAQAAVLETCGFIPATRIKKADGSTWMQMMLLI